MKPEEAIKIAIHCLGVQAEQEVCEECDIYGNCHTDCKDVAEMAIKALKEIKQYREIGTVEEFEKLKLAENGNIWGFIDEYVDYKQIGTVEECREAREKQEAIEVIRSDGRYPYKCPTCNGKLEIGYKHCIRCGQLLKYSYDKL